MPNRNVKLISIIASIFIHIPLLFVQLSFNNNDKLVENGNNYGVEVISLKLYKEFVGLEKFVEANNVTINQNKKFQKIVKCENISEVGKQQVGNKETIKDGVSVNNDYLIEGSNNDNITNRTIDSRSIYEKGKKGDKAASAMLNIEGWDWDCLPIVNDSSDFIGKIVFEIIIDKFGFIIGIKEIEKTIPPDIAIKYKEALLDSTLKRLNNIESGQGTTKGTVTFTIIC